MSDTTLKGFIQQEIQRELGEDKVNLEPVVVDMLSTRLAAALHAAAEGKHEAIKKIAQQYQGA